MLLLFLLRKNNNKHAFQIEDLNSKAHDCNPSGYHGFPKGNNQGHLKGDFACKGFALDLVLCTSMVSLRETMHAKISIQKVIFYNTLQKIKNILKKGLIL